MPPILVRLDAQMTDKEILNEIDQLHGQVIDHFGAGSEMAMKCAELYRSAQRETKQQKEEEYGTEN